MPFEGDPRRGSASSSGAPESEAGAPEPQARQRDEFDPANEGGERIGRRLPAWALSMVFHVTVLVTLGLVLRPVVHGVDGDSGKSGGIVIVSTRNSQTEYFDEDTADQSSASAQGATSPEETSPFPNQVESPLDTSGIFPTLDGTIGPSGGATSSLPNAGDLLNGLGGGSRTGSQATTQIFGAQGTGSKFVYVFDRSSSMEGYNGRPLAAAKGELAASLEALKPTHQFQIIFYNESPAVFNPYPESPPRLMFGSDQNLELARRFILSIRGSGGTEHLAPLKMALGMGPDVIFFLTDAQEPRLSEAELEMIRRRNRSNASINTIEFGAGPQQRRDNFLARLASQNNGQHVYVDVTKLPRTSHR